jgi:Ca2+-transporting ATPase
MLARALAQGLVVLVSVFALYAWAMTAGVAENAARAMAFAAMVLGNLGLIVANLTRGSRLEEPRRIANPTLWALVGGALAGLAAVLYVAPLREVFRFAPLSAAELAASIAAAAAAIALLVAFARPAPARMPATVDGR